MNCFNVDDIVEVVGYKNSNSSKNFLGVVGRVSYVHDNYGITRYAIEFDTKIHLSHSCRAGGVDRVPSGKGQWLVAEDLRLIQSDIPNLDIDSLL